MYANLAHVVSTWCGDGLIDQLLAHNAAERILHARQEARLRRPHTHTQTANQYANTVQSTRGGGGGRLEWLTVLMVAMRSDQVFLLLASALMLLLCSRDSW